MLDGTRVDSGISQIQNMFETEFKTESRDYNTAMADTVLEASL